MLGWRYEVKFVLIRGSQPEHDRETQVQGRISKFKGSGEDIHLSVIIFFG